MQQLVVTKHIFELQVGCKYFMTSIYDLFTNSSTPKAKRHAVTETPPPEASPVKPLDWGSRTPKAIPKGAIRTQLASHHQNKPKVSTQAEKKGEITDTKTVERDEKISHEKVSVLVFVFISRSRYV